MTTTLRSMIVAALTLFILAPAANAAIPGVDEKCWAEWVDMHDKDAEYKQAQKALHDARVAEIAAKDAWEAAKDAQEANPNNSVYAEAVTLAYNAWVAAQGVVASARNTVDSKRLAKKRAKDEYDLCMKTFYTSAPAGPVEEPRKR